MPAAPIVEILTIGREILDGRVVDTNAVAIAEVLRSRGLVPRWGTRVDDDPERIIEAFHIASSRAQVILVTGGLGPTSDDLTAQAFARFLGEPLVLNAEALAQVEAFFARFKRPMLEIQKKQALLPPSCFVLENTEGTAPGFGLETDAVSWYFMPGVPREMKVMLTERIAPRLPKLEGYRSRTWATQFTAEAALQEKLNAVEAKLPPGFEMTYRTRFPENHVALYAHCDTAEKSALFETLTRESEAALAGEIFTSAADAAPLPLLEEVVVAGLKASGTALSTVESCTGGLVANRVTDVPGTSECFWGSFIVYDYAAKESQLGVDPLVLEKHGAVSPEVARALATQGLAKMRASAEGARIHAMKKPQRLLCVATTGIAGPTGGSPTKPVGLCYIALADSRDGSVKIEEIKGRPGLARTMYKTYFAQKALDLVRRAL